MRKSTDPRIVIALGGNALGNTPKEQEEHIDNAVPALIDLITKGYEIIITHGNGPQVGMIQNAFAEGSKVNEKIPDVPLAECTAMSQGYIGFHLQKALRRELRARELPWHVASVVTQIAVDADDPAFRRPTKPIGPYYTKEEAEEISAHDKSAVFADDAGRGWRKIVPSPKPLRILEKESILHLLDHEFVVIACGGGGIPVIRTGHERYESVDAVIDKDLAASRLAAEVNAKYLFILTAVDTVSINFRTENEKEIPAMTTEEARGYIEEGQFAPGSMLPKIEAAVEFAESGKGRTAIIASLERATEAVEGKTGTRITLPREDNDEFFLPSDDPKERVWLYR